MAASSRRVLLIALVISLCAKPAFASTLLFENFDNVANLVPNGWHIINESQSIGPTDWFQGNPGIFSAQSGATNSYVATSFEAAGPSNWINLWLISPVMTFQNTDTISFWTRTEVGSPFPDGLRLRLSLNGASLDAGGTFASVGDFTTLLVSINPTLNVGGFPESWTLFTGTISGLGGPTPGRFAFQYQLHNEFNGDYIGIDTVTVTRADATAVPEPATLTLLAIGLGGAAIRRSARRRSL